MTTKKADEEIIRAFAETQDPQLREEAILSFLPLVYYVIGRLGFVANNEMDQDDLASHGVLGLIEAVDNYQLKYGTKFSTYAVPRIRGKILDYLRTRDWLPRSARKLAKQVQMAMRALHQQLHRAPTEEEIADHLGISLGDVQQALTHASHIVVSLDSFIPWLQEDSNQTSDDYLPDESQQEPAQLYREKSLKRWLKSAIQDLKEREQLILSLYYYEELTMREIGEVLGISESRVCQLHARLVMTLKAVYQEALESGQDAAPEVEPNEVIEHV